MVLILVAMAFSLGNGPQEKACTPVPASMKTLWGWEVVGVIERKPIRHVQGTVVDSEGGPVEEVLVEVFDHGEEAPAWGHRPFKAAQRRLAACVTGKTGRFQFAQLPPGKYEVRASRPEFNTTSVVVQVSRAAPITRMLNVRLSVGG